MEGTNRFDKVSLILKENELRSTGRNLSIFRRDIEKDDDLDNVEKIKKVIEK